MTGIARPIETSVRKMPIDGEEPQRLFRPVQFQDGAENPEAVAPGVELAERALRPGVIGRLDLGDRQRQFERVHAELGLDLEAVRQHRKGFDEAAREHAVAGKNILEGLAEHRRRGSWSASSCRCDGRADRRPPPGRRESPPPCRDDPTAAARSCAARWRRHRSRRRRPARRCRHRHRRTSAAPRGPCPGGVRCAPRRRPRAPPRRCGPSNCCRRRRSRPRAAPCGNRRPRSRPRLPR